ncbi:MAG: hypothetical protein AVDCRST_MAG43-1634, partial [uncultured Thermomicrobiales bacterium]
DRLHVRRTSGADMAFGRRSSWILGEGPPPGLVERRRSSDTRNRL